MPLVKREDDHDAIRPPMPVSSSLAVLTHGDAVVRELDVYLSNEFAENLHLVQFPLQQIGASQMPISSARLKPRHNILQIDQEMPSLPRRLYKPQEQNFSFMTTRTFQSQTIPVETHLCIGKIREEEGGGYSMHLVPIQRISQMRPTMSHMLGDASPTEDKPDKKGDDEAMDEDKETKGKPKPIGLQRKESERAAMARKSSYAYKKESEAGEEWEMLEVVEEDSEQSQETAKKLFGLERSDRVSKPAATTTKSTKPQVDYVESLNYLPSTSSDTLNIHVLAEDPKTIVARLTVLLRQGLPIPYSLLRAQLPEDVTESQMFSALSVCAVMIRGNFCLHSRFVALPRELQRARTFMLSLLQTEGLIRRKLLEKVYEDDPRVSSDKLHVLLKLIAKRIPKGWILRIEDDHALIANHPKQVAMHRKYWDRVLASRKHRELLAKYRAAEDMEE